MSGIDRITIDLKESIEDFSNEIKVLQEKQKKLEDRIKILEKKLKN